jgi:hypothetical protein
MGMAEDYRNTIAHVVDAERDYPVRPNDRVV